MRRFTDETGRAWTADVKEERTPRHHGRWYLCFRGDRADAQALPLAEIRWQTQETGRRTIAAMSEFELRRRLAEARARQETLPRAADATG